MINLFKPIIYLVFTICLTSKAIAQNSLNGEWSGQYTCNESVTNFALTLRKAGHLESDYEGLFYFFPHLSNPNIPFGKFSVKAKKLTPEGSFEIIPQQWISQPKGYTNAKVIGKLYQNGNIMGGNIDLAICSNFSAIKLKQRAYPSEFKSVSYTHLTLPTKA